MIQATAKEGFIWLTISPKTKAKLTPAAAGQIIKVLTIGLQDLIFFANQQLTEAQNSYDREDQDEEQDLMEE